MSTSPIFLLTILLFGVSCIAKTTISRPRIIGGQTARVGQFKFSAAIYVQTENGRFFCGGALTGNQWIITSGTCVNNGLHFTIYLGSNFLSGDDPNRQIVATSTYYLHPDYNPLTLENDIGIIELRMPVMLNGYIQPIFLSSLHVQNYTETISLGFGQTSDDNAELSNELKYVDVVTLSHEECKAFYGSQIKKNMICAGGNYNEGICVGDNGGPLIIRNGKYNLMVGVASFISGSGCESALPSGYTRVYPYNDWIHNITRRYSF